MKKVRVLISGGGSGGHIYPALNIYQRLKENNIDVIYVGSINGMEKDIVPPLIDNYKFLNTKGLNKISIKYIKNTFVSFKDAKKIIENYKNWSACRYSR